MNGLPEYAIEVLPSHSSGAASSWVISIVARPPDSCRRGHNLVDECRTSDDCCPDRLIAYPGSTREGENMKRLVLSVIGALALAATLAVASSASARGPKILE